MSQAPRLPNPLKREISESALRRKLSPPMVAALCWYALEEEARKGKPRPTVATERSLIARRLLVARNEGETPRHELTVAGSAVHRELLEEAGRAEGAT